MKITIVPNKKSTHLAKLRADKKSEKLISELVGSESASLRDAAKAAGITLACAYAYLQKARKKGNLPQRQLRGLTLALEVLRLSRDGLTQSEISHRLLVSRQAVSLYMAQLRASGVELSRERSGTKLPPKHVFVAISDHDGSVETARIDREKK